MLECRLSETKRRIERRATGRGLASRHSSKWCSCFIPAAPSCLGTPRLNQASEPLAWILQARQGDRGRVASWVLPPDPAGSAPQPPHRCRQVPVPTQPCTHSRGCGSATAGLTGQPGWSAAGHGGKGGGRGRRAERRAAAAGCSRCAELRAQSKHHLCLGLLLHGCAPRRQARALAVADGGAIGPPLHGGS